MKRVLKVSLVSLLVLLITVGVFSAGVLVGNGAPLAFAQSGASRPADAPEDFPDEFDVFYQAWQIVEDKFVDQEVVDPTTLTYGAIDGMLKALGDEGHTDFLTPDELEEQQSDISGTYKGIGARLDMRDGVPIIVAPFDGTPADKAGLKNGDIIMAVNGEETAGWEMDEVVENIRGPEGTEVTLTILRIDGEDTDTLDVTITRSEIEIPVSDWAMIPGTDVALLRLSQFSANATEHIQESIAQAEEAGAQALVLDLRNNPGGLLQQAVRVTSQFLERGNVLQEEDADGRRRVYRVQRGGVATDIPMVVLINGGTASSSEIMAGALQDYDRAEVVGQTSFGTGTVLEPFMLEDGSALLLGTRQWLTAEGRRIRNNGIEPDHVVELKITADLLSADELEEITVDELLDSEDLQLLKALELLEALPEAEEAAEAETADADAVEVDADQAGAASTE